MTTQKNFRFGEKDNEMLLELVDGLNRFYESIDLTVHKFDQTSAVIHAIYIMHMDMFNRGFILKGGEKQSKLC